METGNNLEAQDNLLEVQDQMAEDLPTQAGTDSPNVKNNKEG